MFFFASTSNASIYFINCRFINNKPLIDKQHNIQGHQDDNLVHDELIKLLDRINVEFNNCKFHSKSGDRILGTYGKLVHTLPP